MVKNDIPPLLHPDDTPPIRTAQDMYRQWCALMGELGFSERLLWYVFISPSGRILPVVSQVPELPPEPDARFIRNLLVVCDELLASEGGGSVGFLLSRPGPATMTSSDRAWARALQAAGASRGVQLQPIHLATDAAIRVFAPDDLVLPDEARPA